MQIQFVAREFSNTQVFHYEFGDGDERFLRYTFLSGLQEELKNQITGHLCRLPHFSENVEDHISFI